MTLTVELKMLIDFSGKITILTEYSDYTNIFSPIFIAILLKYSNNNHVIELKKDKQLSYSLIIT